MQELKHIETEKLIEELKGRKGIKTIDLIEKTAYRVTKYNAPNGDCRYIRTDGPGTIIIVTNKEIRRKEQWNQLE